MSETAILLSLDDDRDRYQPGEMLSGQYSIPGLPADGVQAFELSVLWYTEGKGDEDLAVHLFERVEPAQISYIDYSQPRPFSTRLPNSPLSYAGIIVKIGWCVRLRVYLANDKQLFEQRPFQLGQVAEPVETLA